MISVIIPTYNEENQISETIMQVWKHDDNHLIEEIIIVDGGSTDNTIGVAQASGVRALASPRKGRAAQMNFGATVATGKILYFLHADTLPPEGFTQDITKAVSQGISAGCYRLAFDYQHWFLQFNCWFTRFNLNAFRFGDQSLFVTKTLFQQSEGFCEKHIILEDQHYMKRLRHMTNFQVLPKRVLTSSRKYLENGLYKTQFAFFIIYLLYSLGLPQKLLVNTYRRLIHQDKI